MNSVPMEEENLPSSGNRELDLTISEYLNFAKGLSTAEDVRYLLKDKKFDVLEKIMMKRLNFGTAGLRGRMGPGYGAMNDLVITQTSQGLATYLDELYTEGTDRKYVVIGYDNRHNSQRFARLAAVAFIFKGFRVYLFSAPTPTPFVPFSVKHLSCMAGIMVTASHNPKEDNGYKVYWSNGAQILSPHDENIQETILQNLEPWPNAFDDDIAGTSHLCYDKLSAIEELYYAGLKDSCKADVSPMIYCENPRLKITFTALHGVSHSYMKKAFQHFNFENYIPVKEQMHPDPDFPTVEFPNPEEKKCLMHSIATANAGGSSVILANDPDADRLAVAERSFDGEWRIFNGNEIGALLGSWLWQKLDKEKKRNPETCCMISSAVSSKILRSMAEHEGFVFYETLTGFKWMANKAVECMNDKMNFVFAFEEAIGYMCGSMVLDKDGILAAMHMTKLAIDAYYVQKKLLQDVLREIYKTYGYHVSCNSYFICHQPDKIKAMFHRLRNYNRCNQYPKSLDLNTMLPTYPVVDVRDLTTGYDSRQSDKKAILPSSSSTEMITFYFRNGCEITLRTSGTEPKVKYYTEMIAKVPEKEWKKTAATLDDMVKNLIENWIMPDRFEFENRPT